MDMKVIDKRTGKVEKVIDKTDSSFLVTQTKLSKFGINCSQWFHRDRFNKEFDLKNF